MFNPEKPLSYAAAFHAFKSMLTQYKIDASKFGLHSPRIGGATDAFNNNIPFHVIDAQGRWKSKNTKFSYLRHSDSDRIKYFSQSLSYG